MFGGDAMVYKRGVNQLDKITNVKNYKQVENSRNLVEISKEIEKIKILINSLSNNLKYKML